MSSNAVKIVFKRSSILGKRPTSANLVAGELGLNTNSVDPGAFFQVSDSSIVKIGPTAYSPAAPTSLPAKGELWYDVNTKSLSIGSDRSTWEAVSSPFFGGSGGYTVFVGPEYPNSTDSLQNDGQSIPYVTVNRAVIQLAKLYIENFLKGWYDATYQVVLLGGRNCVVNGPGNTVQNFSVDFSQSVDGNVQQYQLQEFNTPDGALVIPAGISIISDNPRECSIHPTYVPKYTHPAYPVPYALTATSTAISNQPRTSIFKRSGNCFFDNFTYCDKVETRDVVSITANSNGEAVFRSRRPHGLNEDDFTSVSYPRTTIRSDAFPPGAYYASPVDSFTFRLSPTSSAYSTGATYVLFSQLPPDINYLSGTKLTVSNIFPYFKPADGTSYELHNYSHHRLTGHTNATLQELRDFYVKVQRAFPEFAGRVDTRVSSPGETTIVAPTTGVFPDNIVSNDTTFTSPRAKHLSLRSSYGMCLEDNDGELVSGFKSAITETCTAVALQLDPAAYEVYATSDQDWVSLSTLGQSLVTEYAYPYEVPTEYQLETLNRASISNIRYYYETLRVGDGRLSTGITDLDNDFRHFGFRGRGANAFTEAGECYTIGAAVGAWAMNGAILSLTNSKTDFGSVAIQSEGFAGIGTLGGANANDRGFLLSGITRPLALLEEEVKSNEQKRILNLGSKVVRVVQDPTDSSVQLVVLSHPFNPESILPFSLAPGSALYVADPDCSYQGFFVTDGSPTAILSDPTYNGGGVLRLRLSDSRIPMGDQYSSDVSSFDTPYIRRFIDPRSQEQRSYGFFVSSTNPTSLAPQYGSVLRLNQTGQNLSNTLKRGYQFDPGINGGVSQTFSVVGSSPTISGLSANFNNKVADATQSTTYNVYATLVDGSAPWVQSANFTELGFNTNGQTAFNSAAGSYFTYQNRNYFAAENNIWNTLYYQTNFTTLNGPTKVSPNKVDSPFVTTSVTLRQEPITDSYLGYVPPTLYPTYTGYLAQQPNLTFMRGATSPITQFGAQSVYDGDDGSPGLGIIYKRRLTPVSTATLTVSSTVQTYQAMSAPSDSGATRGRPAIIELDVLSVLGIGDPKEGLIVAQLSHPDVATTEYVRIVNVVSSNVRAIRNYYPEYNPGVFNSDTGTFTPEQWPKGTTVTLCEETNTPEPTVYDPFWSITKSTMYRFFEVMGYSAELMKTYLQPQYWGDRVLPIESIRLSPINGYAAFTSPWPIEFNQPSQVLANTHTWQYCGFYTYSRGLLKYQTNDISRKLLFDYYATSVWGGRLVVAGVNDYGSTVLYGPVREAVTGNYYQNENPSNNPANRLVYLPPSPTQYPAPILVYSTDNISGEFDGTKVEFDLKREGYNLPSTQLLENGSNLFVNLGGVVQKPGTAYSLVVQDGVVQPKILFTSPPATDAICDIRVVTSEDNETTLEVVTLSATPNIDGTTSLFTLSPTEITLRSKDLFAFLSGVGQIPTGDFQGDASYQVQQVFVSTTKVTQLSYLGESPALGTTYDYRAILSGAGYRSREATSVYVQNLDDISPQFNGVKVTFDLIIGGKPVDATIVNAENLFVNLGGVLQTPTKASTLDPNSISYRVVPNLATGTLGIQFSEPPQALTTCNIRVVTAAEFIACAATQSEGLVTQYVLLAGDGVSQRSDGSIDIIDEGLLD
jgi:hypothetical protein